MCVVIAGETHLFTMYSRLRALHAMPVPPFAFPRRAQPSSGTKEARKQKEDSAKDYSGTRHSISLGRFRSESEYNSVGVIEQGQGRER